MIAAVVNKGMGHILRGL